MDNAYAAMLGPQKGAVEQEECIEQGYAPDRVNYRGPLQRELAEKSVGYHRAEADKADRAAAFFREHPEFDEFIGLIRAGVVQI